MNSCSVVIVDWVSALMALLATGLNDEAVARHLGISSRSLRRRVAELMDDLDANNRFQAGPSAARRGLLE